MIVNIRVDHRLLHGQVAFSWTNYLKADCILIANDDAAQDELKRITLKLAKPQGIKLVIKSIEDSIYSLKSGVTDQYRLFIVVESINDVYRLAMTYPKIKEIYIGWTIPTDETRNISKAVNVTKREEFLIKELLCMGKDISIQMVPSDRKIPIKSLLS